MCAVRARARVCTRSCNLKPWQLFAYNFSAWNYYCSCLHATYDKTKINKIHIIQPRPKQKRKQKIKIKRQFNQVRLQAVKTSTLPQIQRAMGFNDFMRRFVRPSLFQALFYIVDPQMACCHQMSHQTDTAGAHAHTHTLTPHFMPKN